MIEIANQYFDRLQREGHYKKCLNCGTEERPSVQGFHQIPLSYTPADPRPFMPRAVLIMLCSNCNYVMEFWVNPKLDG